MTEIKRIKGETLSGRLGQILYAKDILASLDVQSVCDVGCAEGYFLEALTFPEKHGLEIDHYAVAHAIPGISVHSSWDTVPKVQLMTLIDVVEHLTPGGVFGCLDDIHSHLSTNGYLFLQTDNPRSLVAHYTHYNDFSHVRMYDADLMAAILKFYKFSIVKIGFVCSHPYNRQYISHMALKAYRRLRYGLLTDPCDRYWILARHNGFHG